MVNRLIMLVTAVILVCPLTFRQAANGAQLPNIAAVEDFGPVVLAAAGGRFGVGNNDALLMYIDPDTGVDWIRTWGYPGSIYPEDIDMDSAGAAIFIGNNPIPQQIDYVPTPGFVVKFSNTGSVVWAKEVYWSDHSIRLTGLVTDASNNIYMTGFAWKYADTPEPGGWFAQRGYVFTIKLDNNGERIWARRWSSDYYAGNEGKAIIVKGNIVAVLADYWDAGTNGMQVLFYNATNGETMSSSAMVIPEAFMINNGLAVNDDSLVTAIIEMRSFLADTHISSTIIMPTFALSSQYLFTHSWHYGQEKYPAPNDICSFGPDFYIAASLGYIPKPPNPQYPEFPVYDPMILSYNGPIYTDMDYYPDDSGMYENSHFTSIASRAEREVWVAGHAVFDEQTQIREPRELFAGLGFSEESLVEVTAWEDESCGANTFDITGATATTPSHDEVKEWFKSNRYYVGQLVLDYEPHKPYAVVKADVTSGQAPLTVHLDATESYIDIGTIEGYEWSYWRRNPYKVDYPTAEGATHSITFDEPGNYEIAVKLTSDDGTESSAWVTVTVT